MFLQITREDVKTVASVAVTYSEGSHEPLAISASTPWSALHMSLVLTACGVTMAVKTVDLSLLTLKQLQKMSHHMLGQYLVVVF